MNFSPDILKNYPEGQVISESAFTSTSTDPGVATGAFDGNTLMTLTGHSGRDIAPFSDDPDSAEDRHTDEGGRLMTANEQPERRELTDEDRRMADEALEQLHRDLAAAAGRPAMRARIPGKFDGPLGMRDDGTPQPPLSEEEKRHNEDVRKRARGEADS